MKNLTRYLGIAVSIAVALPCFGCAAVESRKQRSVLEFIKTAEKQNGWHVLVVGRGISYLDLANSKLQPLYPESKSSGDFVGMASVNPQGSKLVFSEATDSGFYSLTFLDLTNGSRETHFRLPYLRGPRWSDDGVYVAFEGKTSKTAADSSLYLYKPGDAAFSLVVKESLKSGDFLFSWGPSNRRIVYQSGDGRIRTVDIATGETKTIDSGEFPTWSPDGRYIAYQGADKSYTLYDVQNEQKSILFKDESVRRSLVWSPDSRFIVYSKLSGGLWNWITGALSVTDSYGDLCVMDVQSRTEVRLYRNSGSVYATDWRKVETEARSVARNR